MPSQNNIERFARVRYFSRKKYITDYKEYDSKLKARAVILYFKALNAGRFPIRARIIDRGSFCQIYFDENTLELGPFYYFGSQPGQSLPSLEDSKVAKHTKGDRDGHKATRPNIREVNKGSFTRYDSVQAIYQALFGENA